MPAKLLLPWVALFLFGRASSNESLHARGMPGCLPCGGGKKSSKAEDATLERVDGPEAEGVSQDGSTTGAAGLQGFFGASPTKRPSRVIQGSTADMSRLPRVADLIAEHKVKIKQVREHPDVVEILKAEHDDLFIVRYVMSNKGDVAKSAAAIKSCIAWREENTELLSRIDELQAEVRQVIPTGIFPWRTKQGLPIQVAIPFAVDSKTWSTKSERWHHEAGISNREVAFRACDKLTRESGHLVKLCIIQDLTGLSLSFVMNNRKLMNNQGKLSKLSEFLYPQLIQTVVVTHPPSFAKVVYDMAKAVLSARLMAKIRLVDTVQKLVEEAQLDESHVPTWLGGRYKWDAPWVPARVKGLEGLKKAGSFKDKKRV